MFCNLYSSNTYVYKIFINYVFALQLIYIIVLEPILSPVSYLFDVLIFDTYYQIILCYKNLNYFETATTKATGGGPSYGLNYDDLSSYSDQIKSDIKYFLYICTWNRKKSFWVHWLDCYFKHFIGYYSSTIDSWKSKVDCKMS